MAQTFALRGKRPDRTREPLGDRTAAPTFAPGGKHPGWEAGSNGGCRAQTFAPGGSADPGAQDGHHPGESAKPVTLDGKHPDREQPKVDGKHPDRRLAPWVDRRHEPLEGQRRGHESSPDRADATVPSETFREQHRFVLIGAVADQRTFVPRARGEESAVDGGCKIRESRGEVKQ